MLDLVRKKYLPASIAVVGHSLREHMVGDEDEPRSLDIVLIGLLLYFAQRAIYAKISMVLSNVD